MAKRARIDIDQIVGVKQTDSSYMETTGLLGTVNNTSHYGQNIAHTTPKEATVLICGNRAEMTGENSANPYTTLNINYYRAQTYNKGTNQTVNTLVGFLASSLLNTAQNNYGFYGNLVSYNNNWNFYAAGTAPNYFAGDVRTNTTLMKSVVPSNSDVTATATASSLLNGIRTGTPTANINLTLPAGTAIESSIQNLQVNQSFEWTYINLASATYTATMVANTGHTLVGNMIVQPNSSAKFITRKTATNTYVTYRT